jgi:hypothetical protein
MLDEYKTFDSFWAEAINTACHAINRLYLHKLQHKTAYELLTGKKPNVSYFRVFGCKYFILNKKPKSSKFAPKVDEDNFLGCASNAHNYRVLNKTTSFVDVTCDMMFDEYNGFQVEKVDDISVGKEISSQMTIKKMSIGEVNQEEEDDNCNTIEDAPGATPTAKLGDSGENLRVSRLSGSSKEFSRDSGPSDVGAQDSQENEDLIQQDASDPHPRVCQSVQRDHPADNILESIRRGVTTRSRLANFCEHCSFVSMLEPLGAEDKKHLKMLIG